MDYQTRQNRLMQQEETLQDRLNKLDEFNNQVSPLVRQGISDISKNTVGGQMPSEFWNRDIGFVDKRNMERTNSRQDLSEVSKLLQSAFDNQQDRKLQEASLGLKYNAKTGEYEQAGGTDNFELIEKLMKTKKSLDELGLDTSAIDAQLAALGMDKSTEVKPGKQAIVNNIDYLLGDETNLGEISGRMQVGINLPGFLKDRSAALTERYYEQLVNQLTLENRQQLRGQGQISDKETEMLAQASTRLGRSLSKKDMENELRKLRNNLTKGTDLEGTGQLGVGSKTSSGFVIEEIK